MINNLIIIIGIVSFFLIEKAVENFVGGHDHSHDGHSHSHSHKHNEESKDKSSKKEQNN